VGKRDYKILTNTDCCDTGTAAAQTHPGQNGFFKDAGCNNFDYNCDGVTTKAINGLSDGGCSACEDSDDDGWLGVDTVPECGQSADYTDGRCACGCCHCNTCSSTVVQTCR
jgi:hypothetical protein